MVYGNMPVYSYVRPRKSHYTPSVRVNGTLEMSEYREVYLNTPIVPENVYISPGDYVTEGELLVTVDQQKSKEAAKIVQSSAPVGQPQIEVDSDLLALAGLFGMDASAVASLLGDFALPTQTPVYTDTAGQEPVAELFAPISGIVTEVNLKNDTVAAASKPAVTIGDRKSYVAKVAVKESDLPYIKLGQRARVSGIGLGGREYPAYVKHVSPVAKKQVNGTVSETVVEIELKIEYPDRQLMPGLTARGEIYTGIQREVLTLPYEAVHQDSKNQEYVYIYTGEGIKRVNIVTGIELYEGVEVVSGLEENDVVILSSEQLKENKQVILKEAAAGA